MRHAKTIAPHDIALLLETLCETHINHGIIVTYFKIAFPRIPLRTLLEAGSWQRVGNGRLSDEEFDRLLSPYIRGDGED